MEIVATDRLYLRELKRTDAEYFYHLNLDPEVLKYTGDKPFEAIKSAMQFLENYDHYKKYGYGRWAVIARKNHDFLGWCGLKYTKSLNEIDLGFRFFKRYWNKGYASESARACLMIGFEKYKIHRIVGRAMKDNEYSIRVLKKIGFQHLTTNTDTFTIQQKFEHWELTKESHKGLQNI